MVVKLQLQNLSTGVSPSSPPSEGSIPTFDITAAETSVPTGGLTTFTLLPVESTATLSPSESLISNTPFPTTCHCILHNAFTTTESNGALPMLPPQAGELPTLPPRTGSVPTNTPQFSTLPTLPPQSGSVPSNSLL